MAEAIYILCAVTSFACAVLLLRGYRNSHARMLLWSSVCFVLLAANNALLIVDKLFLPTSVDLSIWRTSIGLMALLVLLYGLIWDAA